MNILVTGGCGFIGSHFVRHLLATDAHANIVNLDSLTYAAHPNMADELRTLSPDRYYFYRTDIADRSVSEILKEHQIDTIVNFAAESHVDRSILDPGSFVRTNVLGTQNLLHCARLQGAIRFVHVSTDEVYGTLTPRAPTFTEHSPLQPNSPYSASKASADLLVLASYQTYKQNVVVTRCSNNYGPYQFPEKLLPLVIANAMEEKDIPVYGDGKQVRDWIFVEDHCRAVDLIMRKGVAGQVYNVGANNERQNIKIIQQVLTILGKPASLISYVNDRPGHDRRYGVNATKLVEELGWEPLVPLDQGLEETVRWYQANHAWWEKVRGEDYYAYYQANYANKFTDSIQRNGGAQL